MTTLSMEWWVAQLGARCCCDQETDEIYTVIKQDMKGGWTARRSNQSTLKEINPEYSLEGLILKLKLRYSGHLM